jgi:flagellar protein FlbT
MPLSIPLPAGAKIIINGAVLENAGSANISLVVHNKANILRDKDVLTQAEANTPAKEIYHAVQNAYLFEGNRQEWLALSNQLLDQYGARAPETLPQLTHIRGLMNDDKLYNALRATRRLIAVEAGDEEAGAFVPPAAVPAEAKAAPERSGSEKAPGRHKQIAKIKDTIAELDRMVSALDDPR